MDFLEKFTSHLKNVLKHATMLASELHHDELRIEHLLYGLANQKGSISTEILVKAGLTPENLKDILIRRNTLALTSADQWSKEPVLSQEAKKGS